MSYLTEPRAGKCRVSDDYSYKGLRTVILENSELKVTVLVDKGTDVWELVLKKHDIDVLWKSPWGVRSPNHFVSTKEQPLGGWLDFYEGGWQEVLPNGGYQATYKGAEYGLHGEVSTMPWDYQIVENSPDRVSVKFWVFTYRSPLLLEKTIRLNDGSPTLHVDEVLTNVGEEPFDLMWGHHLAFGEPFLGGGCRLDLPPCKVILHPVSYSPNNRLGENAVHEWPIVPDKSGNRVDLREIPPKNARIDDQVYLSDLEEGWYALTNREMRVGVGVRWSKEVFPYLWYWQMYGGGVGYPWYGRAYTAGIEPFTSYPNVGLEEAVANGSALRLEPHQRVTASLKVTGYDGVESVDRIDEGGVVFPTSRDRHPSPDERKG